MGESRDTDTTMTKRLKLGAVFFDKFELLDAFGPLEMFGVLPEQFEIVTVAADQPTIASTQGPAVAIDRTFASCEQLDVILVPGGIGTRSEVKNTVLLDFLRAQYANATLLASVCTGAGLLARAGLLDGRRATTNKMAFKWVVEQGPETTWVPEARWVEDGNIWTAGGVAAGIDMALAIVAKLVSKDVAEHVAQYTEYDWHRDAAWDPFAKLNNLV
jgi:transcriptional regulator GlxA family with amidase domain